MRKRVVFIANSLENAYKFQKVFSEFDVDVAAGSTLLLRELLKPGDILDLVVFEAVGPAQAYLEEAASLAEGQGASLLIIVDASDLAHVRLPAYDGCDFVVNGAGRQECSVRVARLLAKRGLDTQADVITIDDMSINMDTYQVTVSGQPVDLTYLEYALLAFFVRHPGRTYSRDILLQHVWGHDYFGGSRTVDVHVRRIRAKLGPSLARHLETIRGVGYLWNSE